MADKPVSDRALARLMRFALPAASLAVESDHEGDGAAAGGRPSLYRLARADGVSRQVAAELLDEAVSRGLLKRVGSGALRPLPDARAFLRRAAAEREEEAFRGQHGEIEVVAGSHGSIEPVAPAAGVRRDLAESPLGPLARLRDRNGTLYFPKEAVAAGERLAEEFERAGLQPRVTSTWEPRLSSGQRRRSAPGNVVSDTAEAARGRFSRACDAMGPELAGVAVDVCCFGKGLELVERERQWPARSAKLMLRTALLALARHYMPPARPRSRSWGADDYRPSL